MQVKAPLWRKESTKKSKDTDFEVETDFLRASRPRSDKSIREAEELSQFLRQLAELSDFFVQLDFELSDFFGQLTFLGNHFELVTICNRFDFYPESKT